MYNFIQGEVTKKWPTAFVEGKKIPGGTGGAGARPDRNPLIRPIRDERGQGVSGKFYIFRFVELGIAAAAAWVGPKLGAE